MRFVVIACCPVLMVMLPPLWLADVHAIAAS